LRKTIHDKPVFRGYDDATDLATARLEDDELIDTVVVFTQATNPAFFDSAISSSAFSGIPFLTPENISFSSV